MKIVEGYQKKIEEIARLADTMIDHGNECEIDLDDLLPDNIDETLQKLKTWVGENIVDNEPDDKTETERKT